MADVEGVPSLQEFASEHRGTFLRAGVSLAAVVVLAMLLARLLAVPARFHEDSTSLTPLMGVITVVAAFFLGLAVAAVISGQREP